MEKQNDTFCRFRINAVKDKANGKYILSYDTCRFKYKPITVEYDLTNFGRTPEPFIDTITQWGINYRETLFGKKEF